MSMAQVQGPGELLENDFRNNIRLNIPIDVN